MRFVTIPENAFRACEAMDYRSEAMMYALIRHAFTGEDVTEDMKSYDLPVYEALHDAIDESVDDDEHRFWPGDDELPFLLAHLFRKSMADDDSELDESDDLGDE